MNVQTPFGLCLLKSLLFFVIVSVPFFLFIPYAVAQDIGPNGNAAVGGKASASTNCDKQQSLSEGIVGPPCWCSRASTKVEKMICGGGKELWIQDRLVSIYYTLYVIPDQLRWLRNVRNKCKDVQCLRKVYQQRIEEMEKKYRKRREPAS